jgi:hypothetical protein
MSPFRPQEFRKTEFTHRVGLASEKPLATDVLPGTLYYATDATTLERSNGFVWEAFAGTGAVPGPPGPPGPVNIITREIPVGTINGNNTVFTLANTPIVGSEQIYLNGLLQDARGIDYSINGAIIAFLIPPVFGDRILVTYQKA